MKETIRKYIVEIIINTDIELTDNLGLYSAGLLSSMAHLKLMRFLERTFSISIPANELTMDNFDTLDQITLFVKQKCKTIEN